MGLAEALPWITGAAALIGAAAGVVNLWWRWQEKRAERRGWLPVVEHSCGPRSRDGGCALYLVVRNRAATSLAIEHLEIVAPPGALLAHPQPPERAAQRSKVPMLPISVRLGPIGSEDVRSRAGGAILQNGDHCRLRVELWLPEGSNARAATMRLTSRLKATSEKVINTEFTTAIQQAAITPQAST